VHKKIIIGLFLANLIVTVILAHNYKQKQQEQLYTVKDHQLILEQIPHPKGRIIKDVKLELSTDKSVYKIGEKINLKVNLINLSQETYWFLPFVTPLWENAYIEDKLGKIVPYSQHGWELKTGTKVGLNVDFTLKPNENFSSYGSEVELTGLFQLYQPGTFKICDSYYLMDDKKRFQGGGGLVISEPIFIEVTK